MDELASEFDTAWKEALEWFFEPFLAFFFPPAHAGIDWAREPEFLDKELQQVVPEAAAGRGTVDKLVKVWTPAGAEAWVFVHVEVQSQHDADFARRMYAYNHRLEDRYGQMPVSLAVLGDDGPGWRPDSYRDGRWGCEVRFAFPTAKLLDYRDRETELGADANPFAAVTLAHLKVIETRGDPAARYDWKLRLVKGLYDRGFTQLQIRRLFNLIAWVIKLPPVQMRRFEEEIGAFEKERQMPVLSPFEKMWLEDGVVKGLKQGIELCLKLRFGSSGLDLMPRVREITEAAPLEAFLNAIETAPDLDALRALLPPQA